MTGVNTEAIATVCSSFISLVGLWVLFFIYYRGYRIDLFRQRLITLRDAAFREAASKELFHCRAPAYELLRDMMNGYLRFAHRISALSVVLLARRFANVRLQGTGSFREDWDIAKRDLSEPAVERLEMYRREAHALLIDHVIFTSAPLVVALVPVGIWMIAREMTWKIAHFINRRWGRRLSDTTDTAAVVAARAASG
jgi:hypothetical protein